MASWINALQYVKNTNGGATKQNFLDDFEPIGPRLWEVLFDQKSFIRIGEADKIFLTPEGTKALESAEWRP